MSEGSPSALAHELRERFRADHRGCGPTTGVCPFPNMQAEDIDEVLAAAGYFELRARDEAVDALLSVWESSPATRTYVDNRYPGLGHVIDRVIRPHSRGGLVNEDGDPPCSTS